MRREYLGDSLDHPKRTVIAACEEYNQTEMRVLPMVTDEPTWVQGDPAWECYAWLLGLVRDSTPREELILNKGLPFTFTRDDSLSIRQQRERWLSQRRAYFDSVADYRGDLFLDPDTGLGFQHSETAHKDGRPNRNDHAFVYRRELEQLTKDNDRLLVIYQHKHQGNAAGYLDEAKDLLSESRLTSFGYMLTHISFSFVSRSGDRLARLQQYFEKKLRGAPERIK
jgi:hypothetical protein